VQEEVRERG